MATRTKRQLRIGELASQLGLNPKTIRYYEEIGVLPEPQRTESSYRIYDDSDLDRLRFIGKAKAIGLTLDEVREILTLRREGQAPCRHVLALVDDKLDLVDRQLHALADFRKELLTLRDEAENSVAEDCAVCSIIEHHETTHATEPALALRASLSQRGSRGH